MQRLDSKTITEGGDGRFPQTRWTRIEHSHTSNEEKRRQIIDELIRLYWHPVYCHLRRKTNYKNEDCEDITQDFFFKIVLGRKLIEHADKTKGKFRTLLLTALDRYVIDLYRKQHLPPKEPPPVPSKAPSFNHVWTAELLENTLSQVQQECEQTNKDTHWAVFTDKVLYPILHDTRPPPMIDICKEHGIETPRKASNMIVTVKRRLNKHLERNIRQTVSSDSEIQPEISALLKSLT